MAKVTRYHSGLQRVGLFIAGLVFGYATLSAVSAYDGSTESQIAVALCALLTFGGFYGSLVGKQSI